MAAGLGAYGRVLADRRSRAFSLAGFLARMPISMTGLGIVLLVSTATGSFGKAGLVTACATLAAAVVAPPWGRAIDRLGQDRALVAAALLNAVGLILLIVTVLLDGPLWTACGAALVSGLGASSAGSCVRARWMLRLGDSPLLNTAYAWEAVLDEVIFIVGPVLVTFLATSITPWLGLASCVVLGLLGALLLARMRDTQPPTRTRGEAAGEPRSGLRIWLLAPIVLACTALGALFGGMEVVIVAFARQAGIVERAGLILMAWAFGSMLAGLVTGTLVWRIGPRQRFRLGAVLLGFSLVPLPFVSGPLLVAILLVLSGFAIAPTLIASVAVTADSVPPSRLAEALGWTTMGLAAGVAAGAAGLGQLLDAYGARAGFWGVLGIGGLLILTALVLPGSRPGSEVPRDDRAASSAPDQRLGTPEVTAR